MNYKLLAKISLFTVVSSFGVLPVNQKVKAENSNELELVSAPYVITISLGDELYTEGLIVKDDETILDIEDLTFTGYDHTKLGEQTITAVWNNKYTTFEVYVTNEFVYNAIPNGNLFISEISYKDGDLAIELYNNSQETILLNDYKIKLGDEDVFINLQTKELTSKNTHVVSNFDHDASDYLFNEYLPENLKNISLVQGNVVIDKVESINEPLVGTLRRHYKVYVASPLFKENEWISTNEDLSNFGKHEVVKTVVSHIEQAKAYAHYVLFGAGMFAAGRVSEAFFALEKEYNLMTSSATKYFLNNKNEKVEGYNEMGKYVSMTFGEAHNRINLLASSSGHESFLPRSRTTLFQDKTLLFITITTIILTLSVGFYFFGKKLKKQY